MGLGTIGAVHAEWYTQIPESNLVAVCDAREDVSKKIASKYDVKSYTDFHELVEDKDVEALTVAVPNYLHHDVAVAAAKAGKHVAVEKPLCMDLKEADEMINEVKKAKVIDMYTENLCFAQSYSVAKDIVDSGGVGNVYMCKAFESDDIVLGFAGRKGRDEVELVPRSEAVGRREVDEHRCASDSIRAVRVQSRKSAAGARGDHR